MIDILFFKAEEELQPIENLITKFNSILSSTYDVLQFQRIHKQLERELKRWQSRLPIYARRSDIIENLKRNQVFILKADTGSGKSTQIVQYLCDEHFADESK
jgi:ATP-dependent RNA helicase DHX8/PRP22